MTQAMTLAETLRQLRISRGFTQEELSRATGISQSLISMIETGEREPTRPIAEVLGVILDPEWLVGLVVRCAGYNSEEDQKQAATEAGAYLARQDILLRTGSSSESDEKEKHVV